MLRCVTSYVNPLVRFVVVLRNEVGLADARIIKLPQSPISEHERKSDLATSATTHLYADFTHLYFILKTRQGISQFQLHIIVDNILYWHFNKNTVTFVYVLNCFKFLKCTYAMCSK